MRDTSTRTAEAAGTDLGRLTSDWVRDFAASAEATERELTALDQQVGDGDFGTNLVAGLRATVQRLTAPLPPVPEGGGTAVADWSTAGTVKADHGPDAVSAVGSAARPLEAAASAFLDEVGGTSGPLFGLLFQELAASVRRMDTGRPTDALAAGVRDGLAAIQRVGDAEEGDKTLVDALAPAAAALSAVAGSPASPAADPGQALAEAATAAWQGVRRTARTTARRGRASYLGDRAVGVPDPGAVGVALLFSAAGGPVTSLADLLR